MGLWDRIWADDRVVFVPEPEDIEKEVIPVQSVLLPADPYSVALKEQKVPYSFHLRENDLFRDMEI